LSKAANPRRIYQKPGGREGCPTAAMIPHAHVRQTLYKARGSGNRSRNADLSPNCHADM